MKNKYILFVFLFQISVSINAQGIIDMVKSLEENKFLENDKIEGRHFILADGNGLISSSTVQSSMLNPIVFGGSISENAKLDTYKHLTNSNLAGIHLNSELVTGHRTDELFGSNSMIFIGIGYRNFNETRFSGDVFKLIFSGNTALVDEEIDLKNQSFTAFSYSDFKIGFVRKKLKENSKNTYTYGFNFGYIKSFSHFNVNIKSGTFYTAPNTYEMTLESKYHLERSDTANTNFFNGQGGYLSFFYGFNIEDHFACKFSIEDLGFISWNHALKSDKVIQHTFSGIQISDITKIDESTSNLDQLADSLRNSVVYPNSATSYTQMLPASMNINMQYRIIPQIGAESMIRIFPNSLRRFECMGMIHIYPFKDHLRISPFIYNSGYGSWSPGMEFSIFNLKHFYIKAGTYSFEFKKSTYGGYTSIGLKL